jgi:predicted ArsR family transcriptional regulator
MSAAMEDLGGGGRPALSPWQMAGLMLFYREAGEREGLRPMNVQIRTMRALEAAGLVVSQRVMRARSGRGRKVLSYWRLTDAGLAVVRSAHPASASAGGKA